MWLGKRIDLLAKVGDQPVERLAEDQVVEKLIELAGKD